MTNKIVKKNLMYLSGEDFYLFCYAIFVVLDSLNCKDGKFFKDYRKLAFLIEFLKDENLNLIISKETKKSLNPIDKDYLFHSYSTGLSRRSEILKLLFMLEKRNFVTLEKGNIKSFVNVTLNKEHIPNDFFNEKIFSKEYMNIKSFKKTVKRLSTLKLETMLEKIYDEHGVPTWAA